MWIVELSAHQSVGGPRASAIEATTQSVFPKQVARPL
jgi:hypothetical protein